MSVSNREMVLSLKHLADCGPCDDWKCIAAREIQALIDERDAWKKVALAEAHTPDCPYVNYNEPYECACLEEAAEQLEIDHA